MKISYAVGFALGIYLQGTFAFDENAKESVMDSVS